MDEQPRPSLYSGFASLEDKRLSVETTVDQPVKLDPEEESLHNLSYSDGWHTLEQFIDSLISELDLATVQAMAQGAGFGEIGQKAAVAFVTKSYLEQVKSKVKDAREAVQKENGIPER